MNNPTAQTLQEVHHQQGATLNDQGIVTTFGQEAAALQAVATGTVLVNRSHWGLLELAGGDHLRFIHNQTTNAFTQRQPGEGCDTVFVTSTARTIDLTTIYLLEDALWILTAPGQDQRLFDWMDRYIFPADNVALTNLSGQWGIFSLMGPASLGTLQSLGLDLNPDLPEGHHQSLAWAGSNLRVAVGNGLALPGYTLLVPMAQAAALWDSLTQAGAIPAGEDLWQQLRIQQGRPAPGHELTDDYNPLEAGLWHTISFDKGCYIGQETIARLNTYQGVKQQLWGLHLSQAVEPGSLIYSEGDRVGQVTSVVATANGYRGLGYLRTKAGGAGQTVVLGDPNATVTADVVDLPFLSRGYLAQAVMTEAEVAEA